MIGPLIMGAAIGAFLSLLVGWMQDDDKRYTAMDVRSIIKELYSEIEHGDKDHRIWLWDKIKQFMERKGLR